MRTLPLLALLLITSSKVQADEIVFYRCTDASGALTVQNQPCPKGTQLQSKKVMQAVHSPPPVPPAPAPLPQLMAAPAQPAPTPAPAPAATAAAAPIAAVTIAAPVPLPELFQCRTREGQQYFSESSEPPSRCVALQVTGLDGNPNTGAGEACEVVRDTCTAIDPAQQCASWQQRVDEAESQWRFAAPSQAQALQSSYQRLQSLLDNSDCRTQKP